MVGLRESEWFVNDFLPTQLNFICLQRSNSEASILFIPCDRLRRGRFSLSHRTRSKLLYLNRFLKRVYVVHEIKTRHFKILDVTNQKNDNILSEYFTHIVYSLP